MNIETKVIEGFMGSEVPVIILDDGNATFWVPWFEWGRVLDALTQAEADFPEYAQRAREGR